MSNTSFTLHVNPETRLLEDATTFKPLTDAERPKLFYGDEVTFDLSFPQGTLETGDVILLAIDCDLDFVHDDSPAMAGIEQDVTSADISSQTVEMVIQTATQKFAAKTYGRRNRPLECAIGVHLIKAQTGVIQTLCSDVVYAFPVVSTYGAPTAILPESIYYSRHDIDAIVEALAAYRATAINTYTYVAYAMDNQGGSWSMTPTDDRFYRAEIHPPREIENVTAEDFADAIWVKYLGDDATVTVDPALSTESENPVQNKVVTAAINARAMQTDMQAVQDKIPSQASSSNKLADKAYVDEAIQTSTAYFDGNWATWSDVPSAEAGFTGEGLPVPGPNNYLVVLADENHSSETWRYKYTGTAGESYSKQKWAAEYRVNETALTTAQLAALNSGITSQKISDMDAAIAAKIPLAQRGVANGVATLDQNGKIPDAQIPATGQDEDSITRNTSGKLQAVGVKGTSGSGTVKVWVGTYADYVALNKAATDDICYITDDDTGALVLIDEVIAAKNDAVSAKDTATAAATSAQSYAVGGTSSRTGEDTDNAKYYKDQAAESAAAAGNAAIWAEGTDEQVEALGGEHSAKTYAGTASTAAASAQQSAQAAEAASINHAPPPACTDMGIVLGTDHVLLTLGDPDDLIIDGWESASWQRTVGVLKYGSMPQSVTDGVIVVATSRTPETDDYPLPAGVSYAYKNAYKMSSATVPVSDPDTACIKLFSCSRYGSWNNLPQNEYPTYTSYSWGQLGDYADAGTFLTHIALGSALDMEHPDFPNHQWIVGGEDTFVLRNQQTDHHHIGLLSRYSLFSDSCDAAETQWALTEDTAAVTGIVYSITVNGTRTQLAEGTDWEAGATSVTKDGVAYPISEWDEKNPNPSYNFGSNFIPEGNDLQWMNSTGSAGSWYQKMNLWDACSSTLKARNGFMKNLPSSFSQCVLECVRTCYVYNSYRVRGRDVSMTFNAKVFPLNVYEIFKTAQGGVTEGRKQLDWFAGGASKICYAVDGTTAVAWWSASAYYASANIRMYVSAAGASASGYAHASYGYRPACAFGKQIS